MRNVSPVAKDELKCVRAWRKHEVDFRLSIAEVLVTVVHRDRLFESRTSQLGVDQKVMMSRRLRELP
jgi:hypothetical protein